MRYHVRYTWTIRGKGIIIRIGDCRRVLTSECSEVEELVVAGNDPT